MLSSRHNPRLERLPNVPELSFRDVTVSKRLGV